MVPERYRGKPKFGLDTCIGCGACVNACPTEAMTQIDDPEAEPPVRKITLRHDTCIRKEHKALKRMGFGNYG